MATILNPPPVSAETDWRIPRPSDRYADALARVAHNGEWHVITTGSGFTVSEQQARSLNTSQGAYEWGYRVYAANGVLVSDLAVRWIGDRK
jgi:hypothetical protein